MGSMNQREPISERLWWLWAFIVGPIVIVGGIYLLGQLLMFLFPYVDLG